MSGTDAQLSFETIVAQHRAELHRYCYRLLGSLQDAEDALQEALLGAWKGLEGFEGRGSLRAWLYRVATNACLRLIAERPKRVLPPEQVPAATGVDVEPMVEGPLWLEPYPEPVGVSIEVLESVELAFVAALQHLPATQRAALVLCEVIGFSAAEAAQLLGTSLPSLNSALQRAREAVAQRVPPVTQQATLRSLGDAAQQQLVAAFVGAWARQDVGALVQLLTRDVVFSMPPLPTWFDGRDAVARFFAERVLKTPWRLVPMRASGQLAFAAYQGPDFRLGAMPVLTLRDGAIARITGFLGPEVHRHFFLPDR
jgi:RNA polymerase sigma-70 factor (TIGR02960 family)